MILTKALAIRGRNLTIAPLLLLVTVDVVLSGRRRSANAPSKSNNSSPTCEPIPSALVRGPVLVVVGADEDTKIRGE